MATARVVFEAQVKSDLDKLTKQLDATNKKLADVGKTSRKTSGDVGALKTGFAMVGTAIAAFESAKWIGQFFWDTAQSASALNESLNKSAVVFGNASTEVEQFGASASEAFGQSQSQAIEAAATFGNLFVTMGVGKGEAADMSMALTQLASDLASFNNTTPDEALQALRSGLVGETEPMRRFGVLLDDATLKQVALNEGLIKSAKGTLPPAVKAQAAYVAILQQTATAQGDFARTADSMANQQRTLAANYEDMKVKIGELTTPALSEWMKSVNMELDALQHGGFPELMSLWWKSATMAEDEWEKFSKQGDKLASSVIRVNQALALPTDDAPWRQSRITLDELARANDNVKRAVIERSKAEQSAADAVASQNDAELEKLRALEDVEAKEKAVTEAVRKYGAKSREARIAALELKRAKNDVRVASEKEAAAITAAKEAAEKAAKSRTLENRLKELYTRTDRVARRALEAAAALDAAFGEGAGDATRAAAAYGGPQNRAAGGIIYSATTANIGERGPEVVVPLNNPNAMSRAGLGSVTINIVMQGGTGTEYRDAMNGAREGVRRAQLQAQTMGA